MRASMRIGPDAPVCACAHALACKIARACARICLSRIEYHNLATRVRTQPSTPPEHARTGTHSRACTQVCSDSDDDEAGSDPDIEPIARDGDDVVASDSESEDNKPSVIPQKAAAAAIDLPFVPGHFRFNAVTLPLAGLDMLAVDCDLGIDMDMGIDGAAVSPHRPYPDRFQVHSCSDRAPRPPSSRCLPCRVSCRGVAGVRSRRGADYANPADLPGRLATAAAQQ